MKILKVLYKYWMKFAHVLGRVQTAILLFLIYFLSVGTIALISFIFRKDFLDKKFADKESFWADRGDPPPSLENCRRQF